MGLQQRRHVTKHKRVVRKTTLKAKRDSVGGVAAAHGNDSYEKLRPGFRAMVESGHWPGVAACVFVNGRLQLLEEAGFADVQAKKPMTSKSVGRIYSMTKCVVAAAVMQLADKGKLDLDAHLSEYLPDFAHMRVVPEDEAGLPDVKRTVPARRPITIRHLLTHTSGIASHYSTGIDGPKRRSRREMAWSNLYKRLVARVDNFEFHNLSEWVKELATLPLWSHPGDHYGYGYSYDVLGHIVELITGKGLAEYLRELIFVPLDMQDTRFDIPHGSSLERRLAVLYRHTKSAKFGSNGRKGKLVSVDPARRGKLSQWHTRCKLPSGGGALSSLCGGLLSTLDDYAKFLLTITNGGSHPVTGIRIMSRKAASEMLSDQTAKLQHGKKPLSKHASPYDDRGLGLSCIGELQRKGCPSWGQWFDGVPGVRQWGGAASTAFKFDPNNGKPILIIVMTQAFPQDDGKTITKALRAVRELA